jgi:hypothetical protein
MSSRNCPDLFAIQQQHQALRSTGIEGLIAASLPPLPAVATSHAEEPVVIRSKEKDLPRAFTADEFAAGEAFLQRYLSGETTKKNVTSKFETSARLTGMPVRECLVAQVGRWISLGRAPSTMETYLGYLAVFGRTGEWNRCHKAAALAHADADSKTAPDTSLEHICGLMPLLSTKGQVAAWLMSVTSGRLADLKWLRFRQIMLVTSRRVVKIQWRVRKHIRKRALRCDSEHSFEFFPPPGFVVEYLAEGLPDARLLFGYDTRTFNKELATCTTITGEKLTSYSFRRYAINKILGGCRGDLEKAKKQTTHLRASTIAAFYKKWQEGDVASNEKKPSRVEEALQKSHRVATAAKGKRGRTT